MTLDVEKMKRVVWWWLPLMLGLIVIGTWIFLRDVPRMYFELQQQAPSLRLRLGTIWFPFVGLLLASFTVLMPLRIMNLEKWASNVEKYLVTASVVMCLSSLPIILIGGHILQQTHLPDRGYTECNKLSGAPSVYFTDWVKDPAWCVYKKDHKWVREQAAKADAEKALRSKEVSVPAK